ncbi:MAG: hypothetical protein PVH62_06910 [Anaerolineae bacterium]|jgi:hypothetical protein
MKQLLEWLDTRRLATAILFVAIFALAVHAPTDSDTWWHLQAGRVTLERGHSLQTDLFSHTRYGSRWVNHSWLSQIVLFWLFDHFSYAGLGLWVSTVVTATFALVYLQMEGDPFSRAFIVVLAATTSAVIWSPRPQLFSFLLTAIVSYILYLFKWRQMNRLWLLPPLFVLWVNLHAGYALGFMVLAGFVAGELLNHLLARVAPSDDPVLSWRGVGLVGGTALLSALLLIINPNTSRMWTYYLDTVRIGALRDYIQEWRSPDFHPLYTQPFIWLLLTTMAAIGLSKRRADGTDLALVGLFAYAALVAARNIGPFALVAAPALSRHAASLLTRSGWAARLRSFRRSSAMRGAINLALLMLVIALALVKIRIPLSPTLNEEVEQEKFPANAVTWIQENHPAGEMFNPYGWGGYLIWKLWPEYRVFVDGRTDLYGDELLQTHLDVEWARPGFEQTLASYNVNLILTPPGSVLASQLECRGGWEQAYRDEGAAIYVRETVP